MIYTGNYSNGFLYGTLNNNKIIVTSLEEDTFLSAILSVNFNGETWTHPFEVPFFNGSAELYFENYIHSLMTQKFADLSLNTTTVSTRTFDIATVNMVMTEVRESEELDTRIMDFHLMLGKITPILFSDFAGGTKTLLPTAQANYGTPKHILSFSFLAAGLPHKLVVNSTEIQLGLTDTPKILHSITIPIAALSVSTHSVTLELLFADTTTLSLGEFSIFNQGVDHNIIAFQNQFGGLSCMEFTGEFEDENAYKPNEFQRKNGSTSELTTSELSILTSYKLNTGYVFHNSQFIVMDALMKSFNMFLKADVFKRIIPSGTQKTNPYKTRTTDKNEDFKFKLTRNDNIYNGIF